MSAGWSPSLLGMMANESFITACSVSADDHNRHDVLVKRTYPILLDIGNGSIVIKGG